MNDKPFAFYPQMKAESQCFRQDDKMNCLVNGTNAGFQNAVGVPVYDLDRASFNQGENAQYNFSITDDGIAQTLVAKGSGGVCHPISENASIMPCAEDVKNFIKDNNIDAPHQQDLLQSSDDISRTLASGTHGSSPHLTKTVINQSGKYIVRRLTPTECSRLQGYPDKWTQLSQITDMSDEDYEFWKEAHRVYCEVNGKPYKEKTKEQMIKWYNKLQTDGAEYKAFGNSLALPTAEVPIAGCAKFGAKTMGSLFDGIGGFPLVASLHGIECKWTSEIELFPIAVTKERFG